MSQLHARIRKNTVRRLCLLLALALLMQLMPQTGGAALADSNGMIRVRLTQVGTPSSVTFRTSGTYNVSGQAVPSGSTLVVTASGGALTLTSGGMTLARGASIAVNRAGTGLSCGVRFTSPALSNLYCGDVIFTLSGGGILTVLRVYVETYLYGVVPFEMSNSYPLEALKAQAVAARTYAMRAKSSSGSYDLSDSASSQVFRGYNASYGNAIAAVDATRGVCLMYGGSYAQCYYTASNGGQTESVANAWGGSSAYLTVKDDPYDLANPSSIVKYGTIHKSGASQTTAVSNAIRTAAAQTLSANGMSGASVVSVNSASLHSPRFPEPSRTFTKLRLNVTFSGNGKTQAFDIDLATYGGLESSIGLSINSDSNEIISLRETDEAFVLEFRRWGHGVGLSQRGAQWMAQNHGMSYAQILDFYYPGTSRTTLSLSDVLSSSTNPLEPTPTPLPIESAYGYTTLQEGDSGEAVKAMQQKLKELGYFTGTPLGNYKTLTTSAVRAFQQAKGLPVDGVASPYVQKLIFEGDAAETPQPSAYTTLKYGDTGEAVKALQRKLKELGFFTGVIGGNYLTITQTAVEDYQRANGLIVDGVATAALQEKLFGSASVTAPTATPAPTATAAPTPEPTPAPTPAPTEAPSAYNTLRYGDTGEAVKALQRKLKELGFFTGNIGGNYLTITQTAVEDYQRANGLTVDGVATAALQQRIFEGTSASAPTSAPAPTQQPSGGATMYVVLKDPSSTLNIRRSASASSAILGTLRYGASVTVTGSSGSWSAITAGGISGYVMSSYLSATKPGGSSTPTAAPTPQPTQKPESSSSGYATLRYGDTGEAVKALQRKLRDLGYFTGNIGGNYLTLTETAVKAFQSAHGLTADGVATPAVQQAIFGASASSGSSSGSSGGSSSGSGAVTAGTNATVNVGAGTTLNIREKASTSAKRIGRLKDGTRITILSTEGEWYRIEWNGLTGYVYGTCVRKD